MKTKVIIPSVLKEYTENRSEIWIKADSINIVFSEIRRQYPALIKHIFAEDGKPRPFVNIFINNVRIDIGKAETITLQANDTIRIIPSIAGGENSDTELIREEITRYSRHLVLPEVGPEGQKKLKAASVLLVGVGGLGSPAALYLAAAGIGRLGLVDADIVDVSNLQRQIIHGTDTVGHYKTESARKQIERINPHVQVEVYRARLTSLNAMEICSKYDIIIDGTDNFATRYLVNDVCVFLKKPNIHGSIFRFEGQVSVFAATLGPCYRCLYPAPPPPGLTPGCAQGGVLGVLPGIIGTIQATETIKLILGKGEPLTGRLLIFDALQMAFSEMKFAKDENCPVCRKNPIITAPINYDEFCGSSNQEDILLNPVWTILPAAVQKLIADKNTFTLLDVRDEPETSICKISGSVLIPLSELLQRVNELNRDGQIVVYCRSGVRSAYAVNLLREKGFAKALNLTGGILAWAEQIDPTMAKY